MFFVLSKILFFLLMPVWWIAVLLIWSWLTKKPIVKKRLRIIVIVIVVVFTNPYLYRSLVAAWQTKATILPVNKTFEAGIVLGGFSGYDKNNQGHFGSNVDRFIQTANLYHEGIIKKIIISGGNGLLSQDGPPEAIFARTQFILNGVRDADIVMESRSRNTFENAAYSKHITDSLQLHPPFILITSAIHMRRSLSVFKRSGFDCIPYPCDYKVVPEKLDPYNTIIPNVTLLNEWPQFLKEVIGLYVYKLTGKA